MAIVSENIRLLSFKRKIEQVSEIKSLCAELETLLYGKKCETASVFVLLNSGRQCYSALGPEKSILAAKKTAALIASMKPEFLTDALIPVSCGSDCQAVIVVKAWEKSQSGQDFIQLACAIAVDRISHLLAQATGASVSDEQGKRVEVLAFLEKEGDIYTWEMDFDKNSGTSSLNWAAHLGFDVSSFGTNLTEPKVKIHPDDEKLLDKERERLLKSSSVFFEYEYRVKTRAGAWRWVLDRGKVLYREDGKSPLRAYGIYIDITERKEIDLHREEQAQLFQAMFRNHDTIMMLVDVDSDGKIIDANDAAIEFYKYRGKKLTKKTLAELDAEPGEVEIGNMLQSALQGELKIFERPHLLANGEKRLVEIHCSPISFHGQQLLFLIVVDYSEREIFRENLRNSEQRYRMMLDFTYDWEYFIDTDGNYRYVSPSCQRVSGYKAIEYQQNKNLLSKIVLPEDTQLFLDHLEEEKSDKTSTVQFRIRGKKKGVVDIEHICAPVFDDDGNFIGRRCTNRDITIQKKTQNKLVAQEERSRAILNAVPDLLFIINRDGRFVEFHSHYRDSLAVRPSRFVGRKIDVVFPKEIADFHMIKLNEAFESRQVVQYEYQMELPKDGLRDFEARLFSFDENSLYALIRDITDRKQAERELHQVSGFQRIVTKLSTRFINLPLERIDDHIDNALREIGEFADVDRCYIFENSPDNSTTTNTHEWCAPGIEPQIMNLKDIPVDIMPWWWSRIKNLDNINIPVVADLPPEADVEKEILESQDILSVVVVPLVINEQAIGFVGFDSVRTKKVWGDDVIALLRIMSDMIATAIDRKIQFDHLVESEERLELALKGGNLGLWDWDIATDKVFFNDRWAEMLGYEPGEIKASVRSWEILMHPDDAAHVNNVLRDHLEGIVPSYESVHRLLGKNGQYHWILDRGKVVSRDSEGNPLRAVGTHLDITESKRMEQVLDNERALLRNLIDNIPDLIYFKDNNGYYMGCNLAYEKYCGFREDELIGKSEYELFDKVRAQEVVQTESRVMEKSDSERNEEWVAFPDGQRILLDTYKTPLRDKAGKLLGLISISRDITERNKYEAELEQAKIKADSANQAKSEFLANLSHEVRTPMNSIIGFTDLLKPIVKDPQASEYLSAIINNGEILISLINDILDLSKIEAGAIEIQTEPAQIATFGDEMQQIYQRRFAEKGIGFNIDIDPELPDAFVLDKNRMRQILMNLIGNAIKFTDHGEVTLKISGQKEESRSQKYMLRFSVIDTGIGISEKDQEKIFLPFFQGKNPNKRLYSGTGLGLAICNRLVERMNGSISLKSQLDVGSEFTVKLDGIYAAEVEKKRIVRKQRKQVFFNGEKVLIADDLEENSQILSRLLKNMNLTTITVDNGKLALEQARLQKPDIILMDMQMPVMDGYKATSLLKKDPELKHIPVVAVTGFALEHHRQMAMKAGCDDFISKPVTTDGLLEVLELFLKPDDLKDLTVADAEDSLENQVLALTTGRLSKFIEIFNRELLAELEQIRSTMLISEIRTFGQKISRLGRKYHLNSLQLWGEEVELLAKAFKIEPLTARLDQFAELHKKIERIINEA